MIIIKIFKISVFLPAIMVLGLFFSCEDPASAEDITKEIKEDAVEETQSASKTRVNEDSLQWCVFGNYCEASGRHYPAKFLVNIWQYENGQKQEHLYNNQSNEVEQNEDGDFAGSSLCLDLPNSTGEDEYYVEITILNSDAYGQISEEIIREGILDENEIKNLYKGEDKVDYFHFREGCGSADTPNILSN